MRLSGTLTKPACAQAISSDSGQWRNYRDNEIVSANKKLLKPPPIVLRAIKAPRFGHLITIIMKQGREDIKNMNFVQLKGIAQCSELYTSLYQSRIWRNR